MRPLRLLAFLGVVLALVLWVPTGASAESAFVIIVHPSNPNTSYDRKFLADAFLKKVTRYPNGVVIKPADQVAASSTRQAFSTDILNRSVASVRSYWQQIIFAGRGTPPPEFATDEDVVRFVLSDEGGIGYVSRATKLGAARVVTVQ